MLIYCGIFFIPLALGSIFPGKCSELNPDDENVAIRDIAQLDGSIWKPLYHFRLQSPPLNFFDSSSYLFPDCVEFKFNLTDAGTFVSVLPTNCTDGEWCWMEHFYLDRGDNTSNLMYTASVTTSPSECVREFTYFYLMTPDVSKVLVFWSCYDFNNGSVAEGIWILGRKDVDVDFMLLRKARKLMNSVSPLETWVQPRRTMEHCTCQTRFGRHPCYENEDCTKIYTPSDDVLTASLVAETTASFLMWFLIGGATFATASLAFIHFSGISECLCNENYNAF